MKTTYILCFLQTLYRLTGCSIDIKTLPPDLRRLAFDSSGHLGVPSPGLRSTISPDWTGDHSAVLDGDQGKVTLSWSITEDYINFKVNKTFYSQCSLKLKGLAIVSLLFERKYFKVVRKHIFNFSDFYHSFFLVLVT